MNRARQSFSYMFNLLLLEVHFSYLTTAHYLEAELADAG